MSESATSDSAAWESSPRTALVEGGLKSRMGGAYLRSVCAQAGVGFMEVSGEEDLLAVDGLVTLPQVDIRVQIKCTSRFSLAGDSASWPMQTRWVERWRESIGPVFLVLVIVHEDASYWLQHEVDHTRLEASAWWCRVDKLPEGTKTLTGLKKNRLTSDTFAIWRDIYMLKMRENFVQQVRPRGER